MMRSQLQRIISAALEPKFYIPEEALAQFRKAVDKGSRLESEWKDKFNSYGKTYPELASKWDNIMNFKFPDVWDKDISVFPPDPKGIATRAASGQAMNAIANHIPSLIGGSADLNPSTNTELKGKGNFQFPIQGQKYSGCSIRRMGIWRRQHFLWRTRTCNGEHIKRHGASWRLDSFASTFLIFSDYMRPAIRLAALMKLHVIYVFTHDSIALGEDGPTHQPVEQLASLRAMPNLTVIRPCDANEAVEAWKIAIAHRDCPVALIMTRQKVPVIDRQKIQISFGIGYGRLCYRGLFFLHA